MGGAIKYCGQFCKLATWQYIFSISEQASLSISDCTAAGYPGFPQQGSSLWPLLLCFQPCKCWVMRAPYAGRCRWIRKEFRQQDLTLNPRLLALHNFLLIWSCSLIRGPLTPSVGCECFWFQGRAKRVCSVYEFISLNRCSTPYGVGEGGGG
jgi:hypothetical protein